MKIQIKSMHLLILATMTISVFYLAGLGTVPFHPDESTQIFMSADLERFFENPADLFWQPHQINEQRQRYRLLGAPLPRYVIGFGRLVAGRLAPLPTHWD